MNRLTVVFLCLLPAGSPCVLGDDPRVPELPLLVYTEPALKWSEAPPWLPLRWKQLWLDALGSDKAELRRQAGLAILREFQRGSTQVTDTGLALLDAFGSETSDDSRQVLAAALIELDVRDAADKLADFAATGPVTAGQLVEPALAGWDYEPIRDVWVQRLNNPNQFSRQHLLLAIDGVRIQKLTNAAAALEKLALNANADVSLRIASARVVGQLQTDGLLDDSIRLATDTSPNTRTASHLIAVAVLGSHTGDATVVHLVQLAGNDDPAVVSAALERLVEIRPDAIHPLNDQLLKNSDGDVRRLAALSLARSPLPESVDRLSPLLADPQPAVRASVRQSLRELAAGEERAKSIRRQVTVHLSGADWRALEQAAVLAGELDQNDAAPRLVELLDHERPEVYVSAAWSLRNLQVEETLPGVLAFLERAAESDAALDRRPSEGPAVPGATALPGGLQLPGLPSAPASPDVPPEAMAEYAEMMALADRSQHSGHDACFASLFELLGQMRYEPAKSFIMKYVRKRPDPGPNARASAVWAFGFMHRDSSDDAVVRLLAARVADEGTLPIPEYREVRGAAAVGLGFIGSEKALPELTAMFEKYPAGIWIHETCRWAIGEITGTLPESHSNPNLTNWPQAPFLKSVD